MIKIIKYSVNPRGIAGNEKEVIAHLYADTWDELQGELQIENAPPEYELGFGSTVITANGVCGFLRSDGVWEEIEDSGGGGTPSSVEAKLTEILTATKTVGGVSSGQTYAKGTTLEKVIRDVLSPVLTPTFVPPSAQLSSNASRFLYGYDEPIGEVKFDLTFNRGSISTGGYRAGEATSYKISGENGQSVTIDMDSKLPGVGSVNISGTVSYAQGDQPKDSSGNDYGTPLEAGSVNSNTITFTKKPYVYSTKSGAFARMPISEYNASPTIIDLPNGDDISSPIAKVGLPGRASKIETYNLFTQTWDDCKGEFLESSTTIDDRTYYIYTDNRGYTSGDRSLKFTW